MMTVRRIGLARTAFNRAQVCLTVLNSVCENRRLLALHVGCRKCAWL